MYDMIDINEMAYSVYNATINPKETVYLDNGAGTNVMMYGEIGMIANTRIVTSKRVRKNTADVYYPVASGTSGATKVTSENLAAVKAGAINGYEPKENDYVMKIDANTMYITPVIRLVSEDEVETGIPAITIYMKRDTFVEPARTAGATLYLSETVG